MTTTAIQRYEAAIVGPPSHDDWKAIIEIATKIAPTQFVPEGLRNNVPAICAAILTGRELEIGPMQALKQIAIIDGKASLSAELMVALIRRAGHSILEVERSAESCTVVGKRRDSGDEIEVTWTITQANNAGLLSKKNWQNYPEAMLWARAVSQLARMLFPDLIAGIGYTPDELGSDGRDSTTVVYEDVAPSAEEGEVAVNAEEGEIIDVPEPTVRDEAEVEEGLEALNAMRRAAQSVGEDPEAEHPAPGGSPDGEQVATPPTAPEEGADAGPSDAPPPPSTVSEAIARTQAAAEGAGRTVTSGEQVPEPQGEIEVGRTQAGGEFNAAVAEAQIANNIDLLTRLNMDDLRKLAGHLNVTQRGRKKEDLVVALVDAFRVREPVGPPAAMEADDAMFTPTAFEHVESEVEQPPLVWEQLDQAAKVAVLDAAIDVIAENFPDPNWTRQAVVFSANKIWNVGVDSIGELAEGHLDQIWSAVPDEAKELL